MARVAASIDVGRMKSLRTKIALWFVILLLVTVGSLSWFSLRETEAALRDEIVETHQARAAGAADALADLVADAKAKTRSAADEPVFAGPHNATNMRAALDEAVREGPFITALFVPLDPEEPVVATPEGLLDILFSDRPQASKEGFVASLRMLAPDLADAHIARWPLPGSWSTVTAVKSGDTTHGLLAFQGAPVRPAIQAGMPSSGAQAFVADGQGILIGAPDDREGADVSAALAVLASREDRTAVVVLGSTEYLATLFPLGSAPWRLMLATPRDEAFAAVDSLLTTAASVAAVLLVLAIATTGLLAHQITAPVRRLHDASARVTGGEYGTQVRVSGKDELAELAGAFNAMSAKMHEDRIRLLRNQETLERTVEERTAALLEKNAELEMFVYAVSHDLKTPLVSLDWLTEDLAACLKDPERRAEAEETLVRVRRNIDGMQSLVSDLLVLSRIGRGEETAVRVDLAAVLDAVVAELEPQRRAHEVELRRETIALPEVEGDPSLYHRLLSNLIGNAIKYASDDAGLVVLRSAIETDIDGRWWRFDVADDGPGVPPDMREQIFHPFVRSPEARARRVEGTGVGLAIVRKAVRTFDGTVEVGDAPEGGALFRVRIPLDRKKRDPNLLDRDTSMANTRDGVTNDGR